MKLISLFFTTLLFIIFVKGSVIITNYETNLDVSFYYTEGCYIQYYVELGETNTSASVNTVQFVSVGYYASDFPVTQKFTDNVTASYLLTSHVPYGTVLSTFWFQVNNTYSTTPFNLTFTTQQPVVCNALPATISMVRYLIGEPFYTLYDVERVIMVELDTDVKGLSYLVSVDFSPAISYGNQVFVGKRLYVIVTDTIGNVNVNMTITFSNQAVSYPPITIPMKWTTGGIYRQVNPANVFVSSNIEPSNTTVNLQSFNDEAVFVAELQVSSPHPVLFCFGSVYNCYVFSQIYGNGDLSKYIVPLYQYQSYNSSLTITAVGSQTVNFGTYTTSTISKPSYYSPLLNTLSSDSNWRTLYDINLTKVDYTSILLYPDDQIMSSYTLKFYLPSYPFGYNLKPSSSKNVTLTNLHNGTKIEYSYTLSYSDYEKATVKLSQYEGYGISNINNMPTNSIIVSNIKPTLQDVQISLNNRFFTFTLTANGNSVPIYLIGIDNEYYDANECLVQGTTNGSGVYVVKVPTNLYIDYPPNGLIDITITLTTYSNNFVFDKVMNLNLTPIPQILVKTLEFSDITYFKILPSNSIDTSNGPVDVSVLFNVSNADIYYTNLLNVNGLNPFDLTTSFDVYWDTTNQMYRSDFQVPGRSRNATLSLLLDREFTMEYDVLSFIGPDAQLYVWSNFTDQLPPIITTIHAFPSNSITIYGNSTVGPNGLYKFGYRMTVQDQPNGLKDDGSSYIKIISNIDGNPYYFPFNSTYRISGDIYNGTYEFPIEVDPNICSNQIFYPSEVYLIDIYGSVSKRPVEAYYIDPLYRVRTDPSYYISLNCPETIYDLIMPIITQFTITQQSTPLDVGSINRNVSFTLTTFDLGGISLRHDPVIYLHETQRNYIPVTHSQRTVINSTSVTYDYQTVIPIRFGAENNAILVSVYGIADNQLNLVGFSSTQLRNAGFSYTISTTASTSFPIITQISSKLYKTSNSVTLSGYGFGNQVSQITASVDYQDGNGYVTQSVQGVSYNSIIVGLNSQKMNNANQPLKVKVTIGAYDSNESVFPIVPLPSKFDLTLPSPAICLGTPPCSGRGNCTENGCECVEPWGGPDCRSKIIVIPTPTINSTDPTIIINTGGNNNNNNTSSSSSSSSSSTSTSTSSTSSGSSSTTGTDGSNTGDISIQSIISIHSIREISLYGSLVNEFFPHQWTFENRSNTNRTLYHYSSQLTGRETLFNVSIMILGSNSSRIEFAEQSIYLPSHSIKMSMDLDSYRFESITNTLQVVMNIEMSTNDPRVKCPNEQYGLGNGDSNDLQWMKLNIGDKSLYGNFIRRAIVDDRVVSIRNTLLKDTVKPLNDSQHITSNALIAINVPYYRGNVLIDPDFSHLIRVDGDQYDYEQCSASSDTKSNLNLRLIIGVVVGGVAAIALVIGAIMLIKKKKLYNHQQKIMQQRLNRVNNQ